MATPESSPAAPPSAQVVGNAFVEQYYHILHHSPELVHRFYQDSSALSRPDSAGAMTTVLTMKACISFNSYSKLFCVTFFFGFRPHFLYKSYCDFISVEFWKLLIVYRRRSVNLSFSVGFVDWGFGFLSWTLCLKVFEWYVVWTNGWSS